MMQTGGIVESDLVTVLNATKIIAYKHKLRWDKENGVV